jgi:uncharacterized glyoxalase superfamily protein PhnB
MSVHPRTNLGYREALVAIRFLEKTFGFEPVVVYDGPKEGSVAHAELRWPGGGSVTIHTAPSAKNSIAGLSEWLSTQDGYPALSIHVDTDDPDALFARVVAAGATIVRDLCNSPRGTRGFIARDPEGLYWSFGTPLPRLE